MAPVFGLIDELKPGKSNIGLRLRLVRNYNIPEFKAKNNVHSHECIFHDKMGNRIHASIQYAAISKFTSILEEGKVYALMNFIVTHNTMKYKTTTNKYKLLIFKQTHVCEVFDEKFPLQMLNIKTFQEIDALEDVHDVCMFDVLGMIVSTCKPQSKDFNGEETRLMEIVLEDIEGRTISCTLWENYADELTKFLTNEANGTIAAIIQFCRPTIYRGQIRLNNAYCATKLILDQSNQEIHEFKQSYMSTIRVAQRPKVDKDIKYDVKICEEEIKVQTINELLSHGKVGSFWVYATIFSIETIGSWGYLACRLCLKKLKPDDDKFYCESCKTFNVGGVERYRLTLRVVDDSGTATFLLWDRECFTLIGKPAHELNTNGNMEHLPMEIETLEGKNAMFKVQIKENRKRKYNDAFTVGTVTTDPDMIYKTCGVKIDDHGSIEAPQKEKELNDGKDVRQDIKNSAHDNTDSQVCMAAEDIDKCLKDEFTSVVAKKKGRKTTKQEKKP